MARFESASAKSRRYAKELKAKKHTNGKKLSKATATYRMGYLNARRDRSNAYNAWKKNH